MDNSKMLTRRGFYILVFICSAIILLSSLEASLKIKDMSFFDEWIRRADPGMDLGKNTFSIYVSAMLTVYLFRIMAPTVVAITAFMVLNRHGQMGIMAYIWIVFSLGGLAYHAVEVDLDSFFYYIGVLLYFILIMSIYALALKRNYYADKGGE